MDETNGKEQEAQPQPGQQEEQQQASPQPQQQVAEGKCAKCSGTIYLQLPPLRVVNQPEFSMLVLPHEKPQICGRCGTGYVPLIRGINNGQLDIQFAPVEVQRQPLIVPPNQAQVTAIDKTKARGLVVPGGGSTRQ